MKTQPKNFVTQESAAPSDQALRHYRSRLAFEADCWDVQATEGLDDRGFVLVDVRSEDAFNQGHVPGAINIPHHRLTAARLEEYAMSTLFVVYCAGTHCNASTRAAIRLSMLGRPVKEMIGGTAGWLDEGFDLTVS